MADRQSVDTVPPSESPSTTTGGPARDAMHTSLEPGGRYFVDPDGDDATPLRVTYQVATEGWVDVVRRGQVLAGAR